MLLKSDTTRILIDLPIEILKYSHELCIKSYPNETGGIIIGNYSDDGYIAYIHKLLPPESDSKNGRTMFIRGTSGLKDKLDIFWEKKQYYLGEWHFHPKSSAFPSVTDKKQMVSFSKNKNLNCPEPILFIIGGSEKQWSYSMNLFIDDTIHTFR